MAQSPIDDIALRRYLLGELAQEATEQLEERFLTDARVYDLLLMEEDELLDDYVLGILAPEDKRKLETHFLSSPERRGKLSFAGALRRHVSSAIPATKSPSLKRGWWFSLESLRASDPRLGFYAAAVLLVAIVALGWWSAARMGRLQNQIDGLVAELESARVDAVRGASRSPAAASFLLAPGLLRSGGETQRLLIPAGTSFVELQLELGAAEHGSYRAVIEDVEGDEIWSQSTLHARTSGNRDVVALTLPSTLLEHGDYQIKLTTVPNRGAAGTIGSYYFRVVSRYQR